jgi:hypothetical protein
MKKTAFIFLCFFFIPVSVFAVSPEDTRLIEEDKRMILVPTEAKQYPVAPAEEPAAEKENDAFLSELYNKKVSSIADAWRAISIILGKEVSSQDILSDDQGPLTKGRAATLLCKALEIKGGLMLRLFGLNQRYALRELVYEGIIPSGNAQDLMSGREWISSLNRAADYKARFHDK